MEDFRVRIKISESQFQNYLCKKTFRRSLRSRLQKNSINLTNISIDYEKTPTRFHRHFFTDDDGTKKIRPCDSRWCRNHS